MEKICGFFKELDEEIHNEFKSSVFLSEIMTAYESYKYNFYNASNPTFLTFSERDTKIFRLRYDTFYREKYNYSYEKIGSLFGITRARVEQILKNCLVETKKNIKKELKEFESNKYLSFPVNKLFVGDYEDDLESIEVPLSNYTNDNYEKLPYYDKKKNNSILLKIYRSLKRNYLELGLSDYDYIYFMHIVVGCLSQRKISELSLSNVTCCRLLALGLDNIYSLAEIPIEYLYDNGLLTKKDINSIYCNYGEKNIFKRNISYISRDEKIKYIRNLDINDISLSFKTSNILNVLGLNKLGIIIDLDDIELRQKYCLNDYSIRELRYSISLLVGDIEDNLDETKVKIQYDKIDLKDLNIPYTIYKKLRRNKKYTLYDVLMSDNEELKDIGDDVYQFVNLLSFKLGEENDKFKLDMDALSKEEIISLLRQYEYERNKTEEKISMLKQESEDIKDKIFLLNDAINNKNKILKKR